MVRLIVLITAFHLLVAARGYSIEDDPNIPNLFSPDAVAIGTSYTQAFIKKMTIESGPSQPPIFDSFNDPSIRQQLRKNVLLIIDKMLSMQNPNMNGCALQRLSEAKAIRDIYLNDNIFNTRSLPRYYHVSQQIHVLPILDAMHIKFSYTGAWFATGFFIMHAVSAYQPVFAFGSELELPLREVSIQSHYILSWDMKDANFYGLGRLHDVSFWHDNTDLVQWAVKQVVLENVTNYINQNYDTEKATFLLSRLVPIDQMVLERQLLTIAHAHTSDRANALLAGSLYISDLQFNTSNPTIGQVCVVRNIKYSMYYCMVSSFNNTQGEVSLLSLNLVTRKTVSIVKPSPNDDLLCLNWFVPDVTITDMTQLAQLIADGKLLDQPPASTVNLERSVKKMMTRVTRVATTKEQTFVDSQVESEEQQQILARKLSIYK